MPVGRFNQKASPLLVYFVFSCIVITVGLLYVMQKSEALAEHLNSQSSYIEIFR
jgi:hypothetical protein